MVYRHYGSHNYGNLDDEDIGIIVGVVVGVFVLALVATCLIFYFRYKKEREMYAVNTTSTSASPPCNGDGNANQPGVSNDPRTSSVRPTPTPQNFYPVVVAPYAGPTNGVNGYYQQNYYYPNPLNVNGAARQQETSVPVNIVAMPDRRYGQIGARDGDDSVYSFSASDPQRMGSLFALDVSDDEKSLYR